MKLWMSRLKLVTSFPCMVLLKISLTVCKGIYSWDSSHAKIMTFFFETCHAFYVPMADYIDEFCSGNGWLYLYCKDQFLYYNLVPLGPSVLFFVKHEEKVGLWDHLLDWLSWKSDFT